MRKCRAPGLNWVAGTLQGDDRHAFISRIQAELTDGGSFAQSAMQCVADPSAASTVNEAQLAEIREERVVERLVHALERFFDS